jgi:hypothetical protein
MFEITCLHCGKKIKRFSIKDKYVLVCNCGFALIKNYEPTNNAYIVRKPMFEEVPVADYPDKHVFFAEKYGKPKEQTKKV